MDAYEIGLFIKNKRTEKGLTQKELADILSVSNKAISKWECGRGTPDYEYLIQISNLFGVSVDHILKNKNMEHTDSKTSQVFKNYTWLLLIDFVILLVIVFKVLDITQVIPSQELIRYFDIPTLFILLIGVHVVSAVIKQEDIFLRTLKCAFQTEKTIDETVYKEGVKSVACRMLSSAIICILMMCIRVLNNTINKQSIDWMYALLPVDYCLILLGFYCTVLLTLRLVRYSIKPIIPILITAGSVLMLCLMIWFSSLPQKSIIYQNESISVYCQKEDTAYLIKPHLKEITAIDEAKINVSKLQQDTTFTFAGNTFTDEDRGIFYSEYNDISSLADDMNIHILNSNENTSRCVFIRSSGWNCDEIVCSDVIIDNHIIRETIFLNTSKIDNNQLVAFAGTFSFSEKPTVECSEINNLKYYFISGNKNNIAYMYDGHIWYEFLTDGDRELLSNYVNSFERRTE